MLVCVFSGNCIGDDGIEELRSKLSELKHEDVLDSMSDDEGEDESDDESDDDEDDDEAGDEDDEAGDEDKSEDDEEKEEVNDEKRKTDKVWQLISRYGHYNIVHGMNSFGSIRINKLIRSQFII